MRSIAVANQKGGVGKTTTAVNLAVGLSRLGQRVCLIDLDPQAHATLHLGVQPAAGGFSAFDLLAGGQPLEAATVPVTDRLCLVPRTSTCRRPNWPWRASPAGNRSSASGWRPTRAVRVTRPLPTPSTPS